MVRASRDERRRRVVRGRLGALSAKAAMTAGGWIGFALGLALGAVMGALLCWFSDAVLQWQHDLGLTLGVAQNLLPLGDQAGILRTISREWYLVIPIAAFVGGLIWAIIGALVAGLVTIGYNHASRRVAVMVEFVEPDAPDAEIDETPPRVGSPDVKRIRALPSGETAGVAPAAGGQVETTKDEAAGRDGGRDREQQKVRRG